MRATQSYANYTALELATDPDFIAWVKHPDQDSNLFWEKFLKDYPAQLQTFNRAIAIVKEMKIVAETMDGQRANRVWKNIEDGIKAIPLRRNHSTTVSMRKWWMAAAILLLLVTGSYFFWPGKETPAITKTTAAPSVQHDIAPGTDKAVLTLADGRKITLDSTSNGAISKQGNVTIIQLNGKVAYEVSKENVNKIEVAYNIITTPKGGQYQLVLEDGSRVWLNAASSLRFPTLFTGAERRVQLNGEGYFEVAHKESMPFIVEKDDMNVEVLGTHFNINAYDDENDIRVSLLEGSVSVSKGNVHKILAPGQQAKITRDIQIVNDVNMDKVMAWKNGWFEFDEMDLATIMRQISRWYDVEVEFEGALSPQTFGGRISKNVPLSQILELVKEASEARFRLEGKKLFVQP